MDWISALGSFLSFVGVLVALHQIGKIKKSAEAARIAAEISTTSIQKNMTMIDVSGCINEIEEIKVLIRNDRNESALLRLSDLIGKLIQIKAMPETDSFTPIKDIKNMLAQLGVLRDLLEKTLQKNTAPINSSRANRILSSIADELHVWIGAHKYSHNGDDK